jgi:hypothetical protein
MRSTVLMSIRDHLALSETHGALVKDRLGLATRLAYEAPAELVERTCCGP